MSSPAVTVPVSLDLAAIRQAVETRLHEFIDSKVRSATEGHTPMELTHLLEAFLFAGGKRLRPLLCVCGWHAATGSGDTDPLLNVAASLEMFHAFALIHDDVMDHSQLRRGRPTVHRALAALHQADRDRTAADDLGVSGALLAGDLALVWSDEILHSAGLTPTQLAAALPVIHTMRNEVLHGQYLDLLATGRPTDDVDAALRIIRFKTAKYTIERPLHLGAALAGADSDVQTALSAYALPIGEAFQLRDDLLGVYGAPGRTGKSVLEDIRDGKPTVLVALALRQADPSQRAILHAALGNPGLDQAQADIIRGILTATGAHATVENMIETRFRQAVDPLDTGVFSPAATAALRALAETAAWRDT